ncbi:hypothetical protein DQ04_25371000 [Trypanosoma grayi]|uniref:hypothetical protein n=1 Tax=Trypanosoma grayi TaxID=71804 RepID=UPI0004F3FD78|nr:hypothetical protein DQ04_25371000 [Trypanosoma grayi]KEG05216.1 hypothetical protein DQ04_25371000 [Trypanosoma grayi]
MVRAEEVRKKEAEAEQLEEANKLRQEEEQRRQAELDEKIVTLQATLVSNVAQIQQFDPTYVQEKPYVTDSGAVNVAWGWEGNSNTNGTSSNNDSNV